MTNCVIKQLPYDLSNQAGLAFIGKYLKRINAALLGLKVAGKAVDFNALPCGYVPLDIDTFTMDNSGTAKEHVGRTYAGVDGDCPLAAYLGTQGFYLELALALARSIRLARPNTTLRGCCRWQAS
jgi:hypothetical protein